MNHLEIEKYINQFKTEKDIFIKAKILYFLNKDKGIRIVDLAKITGLKPAYICHFLRLVKLPEIVVDGYYGKMISASHLFVLSRLKTKEAMMEVYEKILEKNLTISETENLVRELLYQVKNQGAYLSSEERSRLVKSIESLSDNVKAKVIQTRIKGKLIIEIKGNLKETTEVLKRIKRLIEKFV
jgi:ParB family chromosome partitioning protein